VLQSQDVIHSLYIPAFRFKRDVVPGRYNKWWFQADKLGDYDIYCAAYCGTKHSTMLSKVHVHEQDEFRKWLEGASKWETRMTPMQAGMNFFKTKGCAQCHSVDDTRIIGPTFKDLFNAKVALTDKSIVIADENYIRESILEPGKQIVAGFDNVMPTYKGRMKDSEINALIAYMKSISVHYKETGPTTKPK
jgi:cytochrome c oxidase subunit II